MIEYEICGNQPPLCDACVTRNADSLSGVALSREMLWAASVMHRMPTKRADRSWPRWSDSARVQAAARPRVRRRRCCCPRRHLLSAASLPSPLDAARILGAKPASSHGPSCSTCALGIALEHHRADPGVTVTLTSKPPSLFPASVSLTKSNRKPD